MKFIVSLMIGDYCITYIIKILKHLSILFSIYVLKFEQLNVKMKTIKLVYRR